MLHLNLNTSLTFIAFHSSSSNSWTVLIIKVKNICSQINVDDRHNLFTDLNNLIIECNYLPVFVLITILYLPLGISFMHVQKFAHYFQRITFHESDRSFSKEYVTKNISKFSPVSQIRLLSRFLLLPASLV